MIDIERLIDDVHVTMSLSIDLDAQIEVCTGRWAEQHYDAWMRYQECGESCNPPMAVPIPPNRYTGSADAAFTLIPPGLNVSLVLINGIWYITIATQENKPIIYNISHRTLPLTVTGGALRVISALKGDGI